MDVQLKMNFGLIALVALVPLVIGFFWYSKMMFLNFWLKVSGVPEEKLSQKGGMIRIFILTYILGFMLAMIMNTLVIHQFTLFSLVQGQPDVLDPNGETQKWLMAAMEKYGNEFRTFKHGAFHGVLSALFIVLPAISINAMFERRGWKYTAIHIGYWIITMGIMGGLICQFT